MKVRASLDDDANIAALVLDVTQDEVDLILASFDPISAMLVPEAGFGGVVCRRCAMWTWAICQASEFFLTGVSESKSLVRVLDGGTVHKMELESTSRHRGRS